MSELAKEVTAPTLVLHSRGDVAVPFDEGRRLAALLPNAHFVPLDSDNHVLLETEPPWPVFLAELRAFLQPTLDERIGGVAQQVALTAAERNVLGLVAEGLDNHAIAERLRKSEKTVRNQVSTIFDKLGVHTRAEAIVKAHRQR